MKINLNHGLDPIKLIIRVTFDFLFNLYVYFYTYFYTLFKSFFKTLYKTSFNTLYAPLNYAKIETFIYMLGYTLLC